MAQHKVVRVYFIMLNVFLFVLFFCGGGLDGLVQIVIIGITYLSENFWTAVVPHTAELSRKELIV